MRISFFARKTRSNAWTLSKPDILAAGDTKAGFAMLVNRKIGVVSVVLSASGQQWDFTSDQRKNERVTGFTTLLTLLSRQPVSASPETPLPPTTMPPSSPSEPPAPTINQNISIDATQNHNVDNSNSTTNTTSSSNTNVNMPSIKE